MTGNNNWLFFFGVVLGNDADASVFRRNQYHCGIR